jgi:hypothetical protein
VNCLDAPQAVRAAITSLYLNDAVRGPLWHLLETGEYDPDTQHVTLHQRERFTCQDGTALLHDWWTTFAFDGREYRELA